MNSYWGAVLCGILVALDNWYSKDYARHFTKKAAKWPTTKGKAHFLSIWGECKLRLWWNTAIYPPEWLKRRNGKMMRVREDVEQPECSLPWQECQMGWHLLMLAYLFPLTLKSPLQALCPRLVYKMASSRISIAALFVITPWKLPKCLSPFEWITALWYIHVIDSIHHWNTQIAAIRNNRMSLMSQTEQKKPDNKEYTDTIQSVSSSRTGKESGYL